MSQVWVRDINYNIIPPTIDSNGNPVRRHWKEEAKPNNAKVHPYWRINVCDNMLMNLFDGLQFSNYYNNSIAQNLTHFLSQMDTIPSFPDDEEDELERPKLNNKRIRRARVALRNAIKSANGITNIRMSVLYTTLYNNLTVHERDSVNEVLVALAGFRKALGWICLPFLELKSDINSKGKNRPTPDELTVHLGDPASGIFGLGQFTYETLLFYNPDPDDRNLPGTTPSERWTMYKNAREYAKEKGFFDEKNVVERYFERLIEDIEAIGGYISSQARESLLVSLGLNEVKGGGNGWKCKTNAQGQKIGCMDGAPADYCVNNGSSVC